MKLRARGWFLMVVCGLVLAAIVPATASAVGISEFAAVNCNEAHEECASTGPPFFFPKEPTKATAEIEGFTQAGGRVPFGVTTFKVATEGGPGQEYPAGTTVAGEIVNPLKIPAHIRTDVAPGLATNPFAPEQCSMEEFDSTEVEPGVFLEPECEEGSEIGINHVTVFLPESVSKVPGGADVPLTGKVYNLTPGAGWASKFGVAVSLAPIFKAPVFAHTIINGNVEWGKQAVGTDKGDFHDYFEIEVSPTLPLVSSRLVFFGNIGEGGPSSKGEGDFITQATNCTNPENLTTRLAITDLGGETATKPFTSPIGITGCKGLEFPISFGFHPATTTTDQPNEFTAEATEEHEPEEQIDGSQVKKATFVLPPGMTLNPSAAHGLEACKPSQAHEEPGTERFTSAFGVACPAGSKIGTVTLDVPTLPNGSLTGAAYLGGPETGSIGGPPFTMYVVANNENFNVSVRLVAKVFANENTGQVTTIFASPPEQPFSNLKIKFERGVLAPVANPLLCGEAKGIASFEPTSVESPQETVKTDVFGQTITGCASNPPPFKPGQSTANSNGNGGASTSFTLNLARNDGEQYISSVKTELPPGLVGKIALAERCQEAAANSETTSCPANSQIGTATVLAGSGSQPFSFTGPVYLTGPYQGFPYGLSIKVPAVAGPFNFGTVVTRAGITVDEFTSQVIVESALPKIRRGVPLRIRNISVAVNKPGFMLNPTNCSAFTTVSTLGSFTTLEAGGVTGSAIASSPFQVANCNKLNFKPKFKASSKAKTSRVNGAELTTEVSQAAGQANIKSVKVQLPRQLPSRLTTLQKACTEQVFGVNPLRCPSGAFVGGAVVHTPTLPQPLRGPAILVSHAGAAFPDLDLVVEDPNHLRVILVGNTNIKNSITTTTFASTPDVPISSVRVELPIGSHSALAAFGNICAKSLVMPTTMTAQNGKTFKQNTVINVAGCPVQIVGRKVVGNQVWVTVRVPAAGRVTASGTYLHRTTRHAKKAHQRLTLKVPLTSAGKSKKPLKVTVRIGFVPKKGKHSTAHAKVTFH